MAGARLPEPCEFDLVNGKEKLNIDWLFKSDFRYTEFHQKLKNGKTFKVNFQKAPYGYKYFQVIFAWFMFGGDWHVETMMETAIKPYMRDIKITRNGEPWEPPYSKVQWFKQFKEHVKEDTKNKTLEVNSREFLRALA